MGGRSFEFTMALDVSSRFTLFCDYKFFFIHRQHVLCLGFLLSLFCLPGLGEWPGERAQGATLAKIPGVCVALS